MQFNRAKRKDNGAWVYGYYAKVTSSIYDQPVSVIFPDDAVIYSHGEFDLFYEVDPDTVCRSTGMTDIDGTPIYEHDIVDCWSEGVNARGEVQQRKDGLWIIYPAWQKHIMWGLCPDEYTHTTVKIIGNKFDNTELIKE